MDFTYLRENPDVVWEHTIEHIQLSLTAMGIAMPIAIVLGILATRILWLTTPIVSIISILYTVPSIALLAFLIPSQGIGERPALIMLVMYAQLFLVRNIVAGLNGVDPATLEAARGLGMNEAQLFAKVWLPLALPVIIAGVRTGLVTTISLATIAGWVNAGGLGELMFQGLALGRESTVLAGVVAVSALSLTIDILIRALERLTPVARAQRAAAP
ncbi:MAG: ABC transporter permease [Chloroflexia bacterium]|jgi:osmoprotectant transport system permease protein|nr:ABC transporter permease [Chloroflexia bacterium]